MRGMVAVVLAVGLVGCAETVSEVELGEVFTMAPGQVADVEGTSLSVRFLEVPEDSRCPMDATCVWAGDAVIAIETVRHGVERAFALHSSPGTATGPGSVGVDGFQVTLVAVEPAPRAGRSISADEYRATFQVSRSAAAR